MKGPGFRISLAPWRKIKVPTFTTTAFLVCDFSNRSAYLNNLYDEKIEGIAFTGSLKGEVLRWIIYKDEVKPTTAAFGHKSKIVQFSQCLFPIVGAAVASLSYDGTVCVWSEIDGICLRQFQQLLPNGCQRIACGKKSIQTAAISGAFPNIYIINIQTGEITQTIRPVSKFAVCLDFYCVKNSEWLFAMDSNGCATYTTLTPTTASSHIIGIHPIERDSLLAAYPSPDYSFLVLVYQNGYIIVALFDSSFPKYVNSETKNILSVVWLDLTVFGIIFYDGSFHVYTLSPPNKKTNHANVIENISYSKHKPTIKSPFFDMKEDKVANYIAAQEKYININTFLTNTNTNTKRKFKNQIKIDKSSKNYNFNISLWWNGTSNIPFPLISVFKKEFAFAFDDCVILAEKQFQEFYLKDVFNEEKKKKKTKTDQNQNEKGQENNNKENTEDEGIITAQCYSFKKKECFALIQGRSNGILTVKYLHNQVKKKLKIRHKGKVVALCTMKKFLFSSGKDCVLNVFSSENFNLLSTYPHFVSPVVSFMALNKKTNTTIDKCLFCLTNDGKISIIDLSTPKTQCLYILAGHESPVEHIYFHPPTKLILVKCRSLYFWSMITGNLESIINGNQMYRYIENAKNSLFEVRPLETKKSGINYKFSKFGSLSLRIPDIDILEMTRIISKALVANRNNDLATTFSKIPNIHIYCNLLPSKARKFISSETKLDCYHHKYKIGFSGDNSVETIYIGPVKDNGHWEISPQATATYLSARIALCFALRSHPLIEKNWNKYFKFSIDSIKQKVPNFKFPDLYFMFKFNLNMPLSVHQWVFKIIQELQLSEEIKKNIAKAASRGSIVFPNHKDILKLLCSTISTSIIDKLDQQEISNITQSLNAVQRSNERGITRYSCEIVGLNFDKLFKSISNYDVLLFNLLKEGDYDTNEKNILSFYHFSEIPHGSLNYTREQIEKLDKNSIKFILGNLTEILCDISRVPKGENKSQVTFTRNEFFDESSLLFVEAAYKYQIDNANQFLTKVSETLPWFFYRQESKTITIGHKSGNISLFKLINGKLYKGEQKISKNNCIYSVTLNQNGNLLVGFDEGKGLFRSNISQHIKESDDGKFRDYIIKISDPTYFNNYKKPVLLSWGSSTSLNLISPDSNEMLEQIDFSKYITSAKE